MLEELAKEDLQDKWIPDIIKSSQSETEELKNQFIE